MFLVRSAAPKRLFKSTYSPIRSIATVKITEGVEFQTIAREWRFNWSADNDKVSLASAQQGEYFLIIILKT